ncbi:Bud site selection protein, Revert to axial protein 2 [Komagataella phaffii CBS 7435]|uniref:N-glycosylated protein involved in the maintenance of bud site selection during bipolar budding n=2 Tax=Komagataella phaffii TaxID=460519 RepID=C4QWA3_KOMPG|nr:N-glycosylated protein involved in the maintenance of bud site selection during bipolar budding [Komagataella phaffii GS115]AOA60531.1 GQ67_02741T0 [Komagataella phaffii]CAH2446196.1 Bud site selection protein, Revert to axial protein 2 [Komagataella phaffii CBS 7435]AOA66215.1 GQ68_02507T0 [Komagataella phaffii GS115]CAY67526.1 N-glycosylated protein involved in the maintenance of bud site selection during bipolar budding [Komagataella phaffii GS115]CCA36623.1 Bud site selection protein, R
MAALLFLLVSIIVSCQAINFSNDISLLGRFNGLSTPNNTNQYRTSVRNEDSKSLGIFKLGQDESLSFISTFNGTIKQSYSLGNNFVLVIPIEENEAPLILEVNEEASQVSISNLTENWSNQVQGSIQTVFVNQTSKLIYFGGNLTLNSSIFGLVCFNYESSSFESIPFQGFNENASVNAIVSIDDENLIFGGNFYSLGNQSLLHHNVSTNSSNSTELTIYDVSPDQLTSFNIADVSTAGTNEALSPDPKSITCPDQDNEWILSGSQGTWLAMLHHTIIPSKLRLFQSTSAEGYGVEYFRLITGPSNSIMNLTYVNPQTNEYEYCDAWCPLLSKSQLEDALQNANSSDVYEDTVFNDKTRTAGYLTWSGDYQEFEFHNELDVTQVTIQVLSAYNEIGALKGLQIYQSGIYVYGNESFNEPTCDDFEFHSSSVSVEAPGSWTPHEDGSITTTISLINGEIPDSTVGVTFYPNISFPGDYEFYVYTPGCLATDSCSTRGIVNATLHNGIDNEQLASILIYQNNDFDKYDILYNGRINATLEDHPYVTLEVESTIPGNSETELEFAAYQLYVDILYIDADAAINSTNSTRSLNLTVPLNGIFEYSLNNFTDFDTLRLSNNTFVGNSSINLLGSSLLENATVNGLVFQDGKLYVGGKLSANDEGNLLEVAIQNINNTDNSFNTEGMRLLQFNGTVDSLTSTVGEDITVISNSSIFLLRDSNVLSLADTNFTVSDTSSFKMNNSTFFLFTNEEGQSVVWNNGSRSWVENNSSFFLNLTSSVSLDELNDTLLFGDLVYSEYSINNLARFVDGEFFESPFQFNSSFDNSLLTSYYINESAALFGGRFKTTDGLSNVAIVTSLRNGSVQISGLNGIEWDDDSVVTTFLISQKDDYLFIGYNGTAELNNTSVQGLLIYDLSQNEPLVHQPAPLNRESDEPGIVHALSYNTEESYLLVGGDFESAGSLSCEAFCRYEISGSRWVKPSISNSLAGEIHDMSYVSNTKLVVAGNLSVDGQNDGFVVFDSSKNEVNVSSALSVSNIINYENQTISQFILVDSSLNGRALALGNNFIIGSNGTNWTRLDGDSFFEGTIFTNMALLDMDSRTQNNRPASNNFFDLDEILLVSGFLNFGSDIGNYSTAFYNGSSWIPYTVTTNDLALRNSTINNIYANSTSSRSLKNDILLQAPQLGTGPVVGIGFALALGTTLLLGSLFALYAISNKRKNSFLEKQDARVGELEMMEKVPPDQVLDAMDQAKFR